MVAARRSVVGRGGTLQPTGRQGASVSDDRRIPEATVHRLPRYLQVLVESTDAGRATISSQELAHGAGLTSAIVRKDVSYLGTYGTRGVGYVVGELAAEISSVLGITVDRSVVIVGIGNLGRALASYGGFQRRGFRTVALLDADPAVIGTVVDHLRVEDVADLPRIVAERDVQLAVLATPALHTPAAAHAAIAAGVRALLNFAPVHLDVPAEVTVRTVDLSTELQILSFYEQLGSTPTARAG